MTQVDYLSTRIAYIYALVDPRDEAVIRYIGKSENPKARLVAHCLESRRKATYCSHWVTSLMKDNLSPKMVILAVVPWSEWQKHEREFIKKHKTDKLTNGNEGGVGGGIPENWVRDKMRESQKRKHSDPDYKVVFALSQKKKWEKPGYREHMSRIHSGKKQSPELIAKRIASQFGRIHSASERLKRLNSITALRGVAVINKATSEVFRSFEAAGRSVNGAGPNIRRAAIDGGYAYGSLWERVI